MAAVWGILNLTEDSFSDGGRFLGVDAALAHARALVASGADAIDLGAESSNPAGAQVSAREELARLAPIVTALVREGVTVSVDTVKPEVMAEALRLGAAVINDVTGFRDPRSIEALRGFPGSRAVVMFASQAGPRAERRPRATEGLVAEIARFWEERVQAFAAAGVARERLLLDPGMGFFLASNPEPSLAVLKHLPELRAQGTPVLVSTSRKSFIGSTLGGRDVANRGAGTLATELWALAHGADVIRTHDVASLVDAWRLWRAIDASP